MEDSSTVLFPVEVEGYVQAISDFELEDIGDRKWMKQHEYIDKLNMQAILNVKQGKDEYVKEAFISQDKISLLVYDLLLTEVWKEKIFEELLKEGFKPQSEFPCYITLYHEAAVVNLLETLMYHKESWEAVGDVCLDIVDYCHRKLTQLIARQESKTDWYPGIVPEEQNLKYQSLQIEFDIAARTVSIVRYAIDHMKGLSLSIITRIINTHDMFFLLIVKYNLSDMVCVMARLIDNSPWIRTTKNGDMEKYIDSKWQKVAPDEHLKLSKIEGQIWIAIYQLLMNDDFRVMYKMNSFNKNQILKLRSHLSEVIIDQIPNLIDLRQYLEQLALVDPPDVKADLILEQIPEIRHKLLLKYDGKWEYIIKKHQATFSPSNDELKAVATQWLNNYNLDILESLTTAPPKCALCLNLATKRCSRCHCEWYCSRKCQVKHWQKHKTACGLMVEASKMS
ncbi:Zinc finger MYND domain-containing protein 10 [Trichoplax sp. H2]|nr:Zinc finger MYND domain-containing protein 10 [Trichoplax sp. H2]|eukprot:RDD46864.1 Zinc finger MYND domain-containing protein 10 [Trichoplax sp. H2]